MTDTLSPDLIKEKHDLILERIYRYHLRPVNDSDGNVFFISDTYPGVWMEHWYDGVVWGSYEPAQHEVSRSYVRLFLKHQKEDGQLPCYVWADRIGYSQIQECVSVGSVMLEAIAQNPQDKALLADCYRALAAWDGWLCRSRMTLKTGLIEQFCGYDTGHDNSGRLEEITYFQNICEDGAVPPADDKHLPMIVPDMNACFYGDRRALARMAMLLNLPEEAAVWEEKAGEVKRRLMEICFDEEACFFFDVDKNGEKRPVKSVSVTNVLSEHLPDEALGRELIRRHLLNPKEFWTPYPFPAVAMDDSTRERHLKPNSWGYYSQGLTALRTGLWMEHYGFGDEREILMRAWLRGWCNSATTQWGQELHPITGEPSACSSWYSSCMLFSLLSMQRLYNI